MKTKMDYIPSLEHFKEYSIYKKHPAVFKPVDKVQIDKIKIDKKYFAFPNPISERDVNHIINDFCLEGWEPIYINPDYFLTDGQHRLEAAKRMGLKYIDVIIVNETLM
ncbi:MAG: hypothetical protein A7315_12690 [Candidatus Altiarchaeales archaeon WOR_SM1_79]|nr:MAG: hypothetical protein A7315_12690 [Candidatus Altiarchaeales archaeon WOR_SM1_79]